MGHPSDWDELRCSLDAEFADWKQTLAIHAPEIQPAKDWESGIGKLAEQVPDGSVVIGYSMGARLALALALEFPKRVSGLILVSGNPGIESDSQRSQRREHDRALANKIESLSSPEERRAFLEKWYQQSVFETISDEVRCSEVVRKLQRNNSDLWPTILRTFSVAEQPNYWPCLTSIEIPVCLVAGQKDKKYSDIAMRFAEESNSNDVHTVIVPESGHIVHRERTEAFAKIVGEFWKALPDS